MSYGTQGSSNNQIYDCCFYSQDLQQSTDPLQYQLYFGQAENCSKCIDKKAWYKFDSAVVDVGKIHHRSDLLALDRLSRLLGHSIAGPQRLAIKPQREFWLNFEVGNLPLTLPVAQHAVAVGLGPAGKCDSVHHGFNCAVLTHCRTPQF